MKQMSGAPKTEHTVAFSSLQTPKKPIKDPVSAPTIISTNNDVNQLTPSLNPTPAPTCQYLQPHETARPDPHISPTLIPPDNYLSCSQHPEECSNLIAPQQQNSLPSEYERTVNSQEEETNLNKSEIFQPPDYAIDTRSQLP